MSNDDDKKQQGSSLDDQFKDFVKELGKLAWQLVRLTGKGTVLVYQAIAQRRQQEARDADRAARQGEQAAEDAERLRETPRKRQFVDDDADPEAAAMLEELLQETAAQNQQDVSPETDVQAPSVQVDAPDTMDTTSVEEEAVVEDAFADVPVIDDPAVVHDEAAQMETEKRDKEITYDTEAEKARLQDQLRQREARLSQEKQQREAIGDEDAQRQAEIRAAMEADKARIRREREEREARFKQAEAERKRREAEREQKALGKAGARLQDTEPGGASEGDGGTDEGAHTAAGEDES